MSRLLTEPCTAKSSEETWVPRLKLRVGCSSMQGWRDTMEDATLVLADIPGSVNGVCVGIFDGHGGDFVAKQVSKDIMHYIAKTDEYNRYNDNAPQKMVTALGKGFVDMDEALRMNEAIASRADNAGDSRCIISSSESKDVIQMSVDHKPYLTEEKLRIIRAGGTVIKDRVCGGIGISRSFGDFWYKRSAKSWAHIITAEPCVNVHRRDSRDEFLVLGCGGIYDGMSNMQIQRFVRDHLKSGKPPTEIAELLMDECLIKGCRNNMSVIIVVFNVDAAQLDVKSSRGAAHSDIKSSRGAAQLDIKSSRGAAHSEIKSSRGAAKKWMGISIPRFFQGNADPVVHAKNKTTSNSATAPTSSCEKLPTQEEPELQTNAKIINAVISGNTTELKLLLSKHTDPTIVDSDGNTLLHLAIQKNHISVVSILLNDSRIQIDACNNNNESSLTLAIKLGNRQIAKMIFSALNQPMQYIESQELEIDLTNCLGRGAFGEVYKGNYHNQIVAVKKLFISPESSRGIWSGIMSEIDAMQRCSSPYVLRLIAVCDFNTLDAKLVLEFMSSGNLRSYLNKKRDNKPTTCSYSTLEIAWVVANGLADIHHNGCIHRDLKSQNILLCPKHYIKLADFGLTRTIDFSMTRGVGTPSWTAPEVLSGSTYGFPADIYSFGVVLTELDTLEIPYCNLKLHPLAFMTGVCNGSLRPGLSKNCSPWYKNLVLNCLAHDPRQRPTALEIVSIIHAQLFPKNAPNQLDLASVQSLPNAMCYTKSSGSNTTSAASQASSAPSLTKIASASSLSDDQIRCPKCKALNSLLNVSCSECNHPSLTDEAKVNILVKRLKEKQINPVCLCSVCDSENTVESGACSTCTQELSSSDKVVYLVSLLKKP